MAFKLSKDVIEKNASTWRRNLTDFEKSKKQRKSVEMVENSLAERCRMPSEYAIIVRFLNLTSVSEDRIGRVKQIVDELMNLWIKLNFTVIAKTSVERRVKN